MKWDADSLPRVHEDMPMIRRLCLTLFVALLSLPILANEVALNPDHPDRYVVKKGDTLWDISGMFLQHPWHWPEIWEVNPQVENPHLIYPGDELTLTYRDGRPVLSVNRGKQTYKMSPEVREIQLEKPIPTIAMSDIAPFLTKPKVVGAEVLDSAPYIVASSDERLISGTGDATVTEIGDPSTVDLTFTNREVQVGDRLLEVETDDFEMNFFPRAPEAALNGRIISVFDGVSQVGQYQIIVINLGTRDGLEPGHVLSLYKAGETIRDQVTKDRFDEVTLPDEHAGEALVFRLFEKVSYAIVMKATRAVNLYDKVKSAE